MTNPSAHDNNKPILESEKPRKAYEPLKLMRLEDFDIATRDSNVPENNNGLLES